MSADPFCPRHGRASRPIEVEGLICDCRGGDPEAARVWDLRERVFVEFCEERMRQERLVPGRTIAEVPTLTKLRILVEEVGEVAEALDVEDANTKRELRTELVQVGAVILGWLETL